MIKTDGTYAKGDGKSDADGFYGYWLGTSSQDDSEMYSVRGRWGGEGAISTGILDLSQYIGIRVGDADYYFEK